MVEVRGSVAGRGGGGGGTLPQEYGHDVVVATLHRQVEGGLTLQGVTGKRCGRKGSRARLVAGAVDSGDVGVEEEAEFGQQLWLHSVRYQRRV